MWYHISNILKKGVITMSDSTLAPFRPRFSEDMLKHMGMYDESPIPFTVNSFNDDGTVNGKFGNLGLVDTLRLSTGLPFAINVG